MRSPKEVAPPLADYELLEVLGEGGMGIVYTARQASINRTVAIKMLKGDMTDDEDHRGKFLSEAVVTGDLEHPNIVPIYDLGSNDKGALFYSMKRVQGTPWQDVITAKSLAENLSILMSVSDAIAFAHARGIVHRDLKPENIMLGGFGEVLVMDWGIAMATPAFGKSASIMQSSSVGGTPAYMAPEMATGQIDRIGPASDIYLLGAILYEIITGNPPHTGMNVMQCLVAAARNEIQATDKSGELLDLARKAMATKIEDRYETVQDLQAAIRQYQSHSESIVLSSRAENDLN
jgi:serine/threonine protein kinase